MCNKNWKQIVMGTAIIITFLYEMDEVNFLTSPAFSMKWTNPDKVEPFLATWGERLLAATWFWVLDSAGSTLVEWGRQQQQQQQVNFFEKVPFSFFDFFLISSFEEIKYRYFRDIDFNTLSVLDYGCMT